MRRVGVWSLVVCAVLVTACGSSSSSSSSRSSSSSSSGSATVKITSPADGSLKFDQTSLTAKAGSITLSYTNPSSVPHGIAVSSATGSTVTGGQTSSVTITLKPGTYQFFCPVPGHRAAGMVGTLTVS
jgi:plastocyanin